MKLEPHFLLRPLPEIPGAAPALEAALEEGAADPSLGFLSDLPGVWKGTGFNVIWRPNSTPGQDRFLELNLTTEVLEFSEGIGEIPNRGFLQGDIVMHGITYLQKIGDANLNAGLHVEPGIWAIVPVTTNPAEPATVVRMATIPHGTGLLAQGQASQSDGAPSIPDNNITPFIIGDPTQLIPFPEPNLGTPSDFRSPPAQLVGITQGMVDNPNSVLKAALHSQNIISTVTLNVSTAPADPLVGGGTANTAFLKGTAQAGPNAEAVVAGSTFWIEKVAGQGGGPNFLQLQYTQLVLLNFNGLSWPHISVATLRKQAT
jgi:hypothetical protein